MNEVTIVLQGSFGLMQITTAGLHLKHWGLKQILTCASRARVTQLIDLGPNA